jgi:hypothetical protein
MIQTTDRGCRCGAPVGRADHSGGSRASGTGDGEGSEDGAQMSGRMRVHEVEREVAESVRSIDSDDALALLVTTKGPWLGRPPGCG